MKLELPPIPDAERTPLVECLLAIINAQQTSIQQLAETVQQLRDEIAVLKGQSPRPKIAPSTLETPLAPGAKRPGSAKRPKNVSFRTPVEVKIPFPAPPPGAISQGNDLFAYLESTDSKSRLNFLHVLRGASSGFAGIRWPV